MITQEEILVILGGICVRAMMSIHPHSGQATPPMYGDFEAQRHWQEITVNLPISDWYFDTKENNLTYWGLDYPPLTAYHSWMLGKVANVINPDYVKLNDSRGFESPAHKNFMRSTVILSDLVVFAMAAVAFGRSAHQKLINSDSDSTYKSILTTSLLITYPGLILIDNGHFQYNNMSLGLMIAAVACLFQFKDNLASILFVAALNYKQMELYHALPFFSYLLGRCTLCSTRSKGLRKLVTVGLTVIGTFFVMWLPFLLHPRAGNQSLQIKQMFNRLFPIGRGLFEDKVANFWCALNVLFKIQQSYPVDTLAMICAIATGIFSLPSNVILFLKPSRQNFLLALLNTSLIFFLFSFQVHEKSILLVAIPTVMYLGGISSPAVISFPELSNYKVNSIMKCNEFFETRHSPLVGVWLASITVFSMFPLLQRDMLSLPTVSLLGCFLILCHYIKLLEPVKNLENFKENFISTNRGTASSPNSTTKLSSNIPSKPFKGRRSPVPKPLSEVEIQNQNYGWIDWAWWTAFNFSLVGCLVIAIATILVSPPPHLPHLWPLLISVYCAAHFMFFAAYYHILQLRYYANTGVKYEVLGVDKQKTKHNVCHRWTEQTLDVIIESKKNI